MIQDVNRLDYRGWPTDYGRRLEDDQRFCFLQINKDRLNPFKCSEMILNYEEKMIDDVNRMEGDLHTTEDNLQTTEDNLQTTEDDPTSN